MTTENESTTTQPTDDEIRAHYDKISRSERIADQYDARRMLLHHGSMLSAGTQQSAAPAPAAPPPPPAVPALETVSQRVTRLLHSPIQADIEEAIRLSKAVAESKVSGTDYAGPAPAAAAPAPLAAPATSAPPPGPAPASHQNAPFDVYGEADRLAATGRIQDAALARVAILNDIPGYLAAGAARRR